MSVEPSPATPAAPTVERAADPDRKPLAEVLARAFRDDPVWN